MVNYKCDRCGFNTEHKNNFRKHIHRKFTCKPLLNNIDISIIRNKFNSKNNEVVKDSNSIGIKINKIYQCNHCYKLFNTINKLDEHLKLECKMSTDFNNIYKFNKKKLGKYIYKKGGDIYIIQNNLECKDCYKIGITTSLKKRLSDYRCGSVTEPRLLYYYPCKNIKDIDKIMKKNLNKFNIKREIYTGNIDDIRNEIKKLQEENGEILEYQPDIRTIDISECLGCHKIFSSDIKRIKHSNECKLYNDIKNKILKSKYTCKYCNKSFNKRQNRWRHEKDFCNMKKENNDILFNKNVEINKLKEENLKLKKEIHILKNKLKNK